MTRRFWSLRPSPAPEPIIRAPRLEPAPEGLAPTRRWFIGALGLIIAKPEILVPVPGRADLIRPGNWFEVYESQGQDDGTHALVYALLRADAIRRIPVMYEAERPLFARMKAKGLGWKPLDEPLRGY